MENKIRLWPIIQKYNILVMPNHHLSPSSISPLTAGRKHHIRTGDSTIIATFGRQVNDT